MPYLLVRHRVTEFSQWKSVYDNHLPAREDSGLKERALLRNADDLQDLVILFEVADMDEARRFIQSEEVKQQMQSGGVVGEPEMIMLEVAERVPV